MERLLKYLKAAELAILCTMRNVCLMPKVAMIVQDEAKPTVAGDVCPTVPGLHVYSKLRIQEIVLSAECVYI